MEYADLGKTSRKVTPDSRAKPKPNPLLGEMPYFREIISVSGKSVDPLFASAPWVKSAESYSFLEGKVAAAASTLKEKSGDSGFVLRLGNGAIIIGAFDGVSGKPKDYMASMVCCEAVAGFLTRTTAASLSDALIHSQKTLRAHPEWIKQPAGKKPGCACCVVRISSNGKFDAAWAGDCGATIIRNGVFRTEPVTSFQRTESFDPEKLSNASRIVGDLNVYLGKNAEMCGSKSGGLFHGDLLLVYSDGLENLTPKELGAISTSYSNLENVAINILRASDSRIQPMPYENAFKESVLGKADDRIFFVYRHG